MISTTQILDALVARIQAANLFDRIEVSYEPDLPDALESLRILERSVCLVVPGDEKWQHNIDPSGEPILAELVHEFDLLISDRHFGGLGRAPAARRSQGSGLDAAQTGAIPAKDALQHALCWEDLGIPGLLVMPQGASQITLRFDEDDKTPGRLAWAVSLEVRVTIEQT